MKLKREQVYYIERLSKIYGFDSNEVKNMFKKASQLVFDLEFQEKFNYFLAEQILKLKKEQIQDFLKNKKNFVKYYSKEEILKKNLN